MKNILITGFPGIGKTTLIIKLSEIFKEFNPAGFYTAEIIENGLRTGFELVSLYGDSKMLAHVNIKSKHSVGKYKIDIKGFESLLDNIFSREKKTGLYIIDEIDKMECKSRKFSKLIIALLDSDTPVIASISEKGTGLIAEIKKREDIKLVELTPNNRDLKLKELTMEIRDMLLE
ncbi:MAG: nucleoside-triphosphatase [Nitrospirota bacterium]